VGRGGDRVAVPVLRLVKRPSNQRRLAEGCQEPITVDARWIVDQRLAALFHVQSNRGGFVGSAEQQCHGGRIDAAPVTAGPLVSIGVAAERAVQVRLTDVWIGRAEGNVLIGPGQQTQGFLVGVAFGLQLLEDSVRIPDRSRPRQRQRQQLTQPDVAGVMLPSLRQHVVGQQGRAVFEVVFGLFAARFGGKSGSGHASASGQVGKLILALVPHP